MVKTVSGSVASWPATGNVTTRPLPVLDLEQHAGGEGEEGEEGEAALLWQPNPESYQDQYKVSRSYCIFWWEMRGGYSGCFVLLCLSNRCTYVWGNDDGPGKKGCEKMIEERRVPPAGGNTSRLSFATNNRKKRVRIGMWRGKMYPATSAHDYFWLHR